MPQGDVISLKWVLAAWSKPLVKPADSAMRFTPKVSEAPSAFAVAERPGGPAKLRRFADSWVEKLWLSAVSNDGAGNCMFEALGQAFAKADKAPTDAGTVRTAVVAKMMILEENFKPLFCGTDGAGGPGPWRRCCTGMRMDGDVGWLQGVACCHGALKFAHCCRETWSCDCVGG